MDRKTIGLIATVATVLLCACPGIFLCFFGIGTAIGGTTMSLDNSVPRIEPVFGYLFMCLSLIFIAIPIVVGVITLRNPKDAAPAVIDVKPVDEPTAGTNDKPKPPAPSVDDEPLPPAS